MSWLDHMFLELGRPEYFPTPEILASSLAWNLAGNGWRSGHSGASSRQSGLVYEKIAKSSGTRALLIEEARPTSEHEIADLVKLLADCGIEMLDSESREVANSLLDSLRGITSGKAKGRSAVPLVPGAALLQDARGMHSKRNPANFGRIFNQLYAAGHGGEVSAREASTLWLRACEAPSSNPLINAVAVSTMAIATKGQQDFQFDRTETDEIRRARPVWLTASDNTPFSWFYKAWNNVCRDEWRDALPRRRWTDWCTAILRTALAAGILWEARFYRTLCLQLLTDELDPATLESDLLSGRNLLLDWKIRETPVTTRDVLPSMRRLIIDGIECQHALESLEEDLESAGLTHGETFRGQSGLRDWIVGMKRHLAGPEGGEAADRLRGAFGQTQRSLHRNLEDTVRYALTCRKEAGSDADIYGLLRRRSRKFLVVEPGPEWIVVIASMCAESPGAITTLSDLRRDLGRLGLFPPREVVIRELERAGLTRSSHDADDAIEITPAFGSVDVE